MTVLPSHLKPISLRVIHGASSLFPTTWRTLDQPYWWLWWLEEPGAWIEHARGRLLVPPRQVVLWPPGAVNAAGATGRPRITYLQVDLPLLAEGLAATGALAPQVLPADPLLDQLAQRADRGSKGATPPGWAESFAWAAIATWLDGLSDPVRAGLQQEHDALMPLQPLLRLIDEHLADPLPIESLARTCGCSVATVGRLMRRHLHTTPSRWIRHRRCVQASVLLTTSTLGIDDIARRCGFANRFLLTRHFTAYTQGISPARFRQRAYG